MKMYVLHMYVLQMYCIKMGFNTAILKLEGNVLRNLRPAMFQMLMGKDIQIFMISKYPRYPNIHDIQISMISKYP